MGRSWYSRLAITLAASQHLVPSVFAQETLTSLVPFVETVVIPSELPTPTESASPTSTPTREPQVHIIKTGAGGFKLDPAEIHNVSIGDTVSWEFYPSGHSIVRAEYASACVPYEYTGKGKVGFYSGPMMVNNTNELKYFNITINTTEPIFFYCGAENSCIGHAMVGAINPNSTQTLASQVHAAVMADFMIVPGEEVPSEATSSLSTGPTSTPTVSAAAVPPPSEAQGSGKLSTGVIVGIALGIAAFVVICAVLFFFVGKRRSHKQHNNPDPPHNHPNMSQHPHQQQQQQQQYAEAGLTSPNFNNPRANTTSGYATPPLHGNGQAGDYGFNSPPQYAVGEQYWGNVTPQQQQQQQQGLGHHVALSNGSVLSQQQIEQLKYGQLSSQPAELHSPPIGQEAFRSELEAREGRK